MARGAAAGATVAPPDDDDAAASLASDDPSDVSVRDCDALYLEEDECAGRLTCGLCKKRVPRDLRTALCSRRGCSFTFCLVCHPDLDEDAWCPQHPPPAVAVPPAAKRAKRRPEA